MYRALLLAGFLLVTSAGLSAQNMPSPQSNNPSRAGEKTIQGCLSEESGSFALTDNQGTQWVLAGNGLDTYVGHDVLARGKQDKPAITSENGAKTTNTSAGTLPSFQVVSISEISGSCPDRERQ